MTATTKRTKPEWSTVVTAEIEADADEGTFTYLIRNAKGEVVLEHPGQAVSERAAQMEITRFLLEEHDYVPARRWDGMTRSFRRV